jgi:hypothetical protein
LDHAITSPAVQVSAGPGARAVIRPCFVQIYQSFEQIDFDRQTAEDLVHDDPHWSAIRAAATRALSRLEALRREAMGACDSGARPAIRNIRDDNANRNEGHMSEEPKQYRFAANAGELVIATGSHRGIHFRASAEGAQDVVLSVDEARRVVSALVELIIDVENDFASP